MGTRTISALPLAALTALSMLGCANMSFYKETNHKLHPAPVPAKKVNVYQQPEDLTSEWVELGIYRGKAPSVAEAMETAKRECARRGASYYILNTSPYLSGKGYKVDGICAAPADATSGAKTGGKKVK